MQRTVIAGALRRVPVEESPTVPASTVLASTRECTYRYHAVASPTSARRPRRRPQCSPRGPLAVLRSDHRSIMRYRPACAGSRQLVREYPSPRVKSVAHSARNRTLARTTSPRPYRPEGPDGRLRPLRQGLLERRRTSTLRPPGGTRHWRTRRTGRAGLACLGRDAFAGSGSPASASTRAEAALPVFSEGTLAEPFRWTAATPTIAQSIARRWNFR